MNRFVLATAAAAALALALAASAQAAPKYYFSCSGGSKVQNNQPQDWTTTAPASVQSGAGCGSVDPGLLSGVTQGVELDFYGGGRHTGPIQALNVELHSLLLTRLRARPDPGVRVSLLVDGEDVLGGPQDFRVTPVLSSTGLSEAYGFSIARAPTVDADGNEVAVPLVPGDGEHVVSLQFSSRFADYQNAWVWGASEAPSHVEVDPAVPTAPTVLAAD